MFARKTTVQPSSDETAIILLSSFEHSKLKELKKKINVAFTNLTVQSSHDETIGFFENTFHTNNLSIILAIYRNIDKVYHTKINENQSGRLASVINDLHNLSTDEVSVIKQLLMEHSYAKKKETGDS